MVLAVLLGAAGAARGASGGFVFTAQNRYVSGELGGAQGSGSQTIPAGAANFGVFDAATSLTLPTYGGTANQRQRSELGLLAITVVGSSTCSRPAMAGTGVADTRSYTSVNFDLDETTDLSLVASGTVFGGATITPSIKLTGPGPTTIVDYTAVGGQFPSPFSHSANLTLAPGSYQFVVDMQSHDAAFGGQNRGVPSFNVALSIPEPGGAAGVAAAAAAAAVFTSASARARTGRRR